MFQKFLCFIPHCTGLLPTKEGRWLVAIVYLWLGATVGLRTKKSNSFSSSDFDHSSKLVQLPHGYGMVWVYVLFMSFALLHWLMVDLPL